MLKQNSCQLVNNIKQLLIVIMQHIPYKTQIILAVLYTWSWTFFQLNRLANFTLGVFLRYIPDYLLLDTNPKASIKVLKAFDSKCRDVTKRLKIFMKYKWDDEACDYKGGIDLEAFSKYIDSEIICVAYIFEKQINIRSISAFIKMMVNTPPYISFAIVDVKKKIINKVKHGIETEESILFGEVDFH